MSDTTIRLIDQLRESANEVFDRVGGGVEGEEREWLTGLQKKMETVSANIKDIETAASQFNGPTNTLMVGNLDADSSVESFALYTDITRSHRWLDKTHEYAGAAAAYLSGNTLKRSYSSVAKSRRKPQTNSHIAQPMHLNRLIDGVNKMFQDMKLIISRPGNTQLNAIVEVKLDRVLKAVLIFKGLMIEWVVVKGWEEELLKSDGQVDIWGESRFQVFQRITENANAAMLHFQSPVYPDLAIRSFMTYLHSFNSLFSDKCKQCGMHLHNHLPPTWREFRTLEPFHEDCRP
ncbi:mediator of RNA polymerase II transcription subunit 27 isoform X3 [Eurytemora carolleeae]|uniref:mediator of RNA polymerase II transcription subunit 27 isoform X1 n=1 Tax=Eurytemora carolleeae TaxID=1294199 RepID=UPI000C794057|nr:mediator of RNA polymerase II transcription subunit 27 isoform X1 [Eurytemora carolleeae]XP_023329089.1 mediator of RNA polymerase II transcription subunit 27 isoform X2 [Eurytemora carolleeae]XP_023329090.1 mediator of RNA polymerase II transcription subunit 27 isoform X3 [Eurytemora carolleeae]|eukprot:XP_023329088.1 mediator of RNA polymerase II transcription subunit 27-like isoform X1 [Eurytemora affinis]